MPRAGFEPAIPARERPETQPLNRAATGIRIKTYRLVDIYPATQSPNEIFTNPFAVTLKNTWIFKNSAVVNKFYGLVWAA